MRCIKLIDFNSFCRWVFSLFPSPGLCFMFRLIQFTRFDEIISHTRSTRIHRHSARCLCFKKPLSCSPLMRGSEAFVIISISINLISWQDPLSILDDVELSQRFRCRYSSVDDDNLRSFGWSFSAFSCSFCSQHFLLVNLARSMCVQSFFSCFAHCWMLEMQIEVQNVDELIDLIRGTRK